MKVEDFRLLYDYNAWANQRTLDACAALTSEQFTRDLGSSFCSVRDTLAHIIGGEWVWLERWLGRIPSAVPAAADLPDFDSVRQRMVQIDGDLVEYVASLTPDDIQRVLKYKTTKGAPQEQPLWQTLQHLVNHGTHHRGQVMTMLRQLGAKPTGTGLIEFYRERGTQPG